MVGTRDTPPDIQDAMPIRSSNMEGDQSSPDFNAALARKLGRECYQSSTDWINASKRAKWNDSLRAFQSLHPSGSKYLSTDYRYRSRLYRPKTRSMVRKGEATTAQAFFSNEDVVNISPQDDNDQQQLASSKIMERLLQYRLTKTIPWFLTIVGARQDAEVMGICIGKAFWKYSERQTGSETRLKLDPTTGQPQLSDEGLHQFETFDQYEKVDDHPWIDLVAPENFRFDPGADWRNPVATSPYLIELIPMYINDVKAKIESGEWLDVGESSLYASDNLDDDVTRRSREQGRIPGKDHDAWKPREFDICWVRENIIRHEGKDWHFFSLGSGELLTNPVPLNKVYLQGIRPYVCGFIIPEAHKTYPSGKVELVKDLQTQTNDVGNLRLDNVKLALNPRQFIKTGSQIDPQDIRIFNPGKVVLAANPQTDVNWDRPPDVTQGSYQEQDRINIDFDELSGDASNSSIQANRSIYETMGNMEMMQGNASVVAEYEQRVFAETFVEPVIRQLVKLEQAYETDPVVLAIAGREAQLFQKFGINQITDELLRQELTTKVNVGIGATNPQMKLKNLVNAVDIMGKIFGPAAAQGANFQEVAKEVFGLCGYRDGERFFKPDFDPSQAGQGAPQGQQPPGAPGQMIDPTRVPVAQIQQQGKQQEAALKAQTTSQGQQLDFKKALLHEQAETQRTAMKLSHDVHMEMFPLMQPHPLLASLMGGMNVQQQQ